MSFFEPLQGSRLYVTEEAGQGWVGFLIPSTVKPPAGIDLLQALTDPTIDGSFVFSTRTPDFTPAGALATFIAALDAILQQVPAGRAFLWLTDLANIVSATVCAMGMNATGKQVVGGLTAPITAALHFQAASGMSLGLDGDALTINGNNGLSFLVGTQVVGQNISAATVPFTGPARGTFQIDSSGPYYVQRLALHDQLNWGFQFTFPVTDPVRPAIAEWLPLASGSDPSGADLLGFIASIDPSDPLNRVFPDRTMLGFTGHNYDGTPTLLTSGFSTTAGAPITLVPVPAGSPGAARLVFVEGIDTEADQPFQAAPEGDFVLSVPGSPAGQPQALLCGLQGSEYIGFQPLGDAYAGDRLRFTPGQPAFAARYPFPESNPTLPPIDPAAPPLGPTYLTSWATVVRADGGPVPYVAEPKGATQYGRDDLIFPTWNTLFGGKSSSGVLPGDVPFPLAPYAGVTAGDGKVAFDAEDIEDFERQVIGPWRRATIGQAPKTSSVKACLGLADPAAPHNTTTPAGLLVSLDGAGGWTKVLLGQNLEPALRQLYFCQPDATLEQALQTGQLFLVVANAAHLGTLSGAGTGSCTPGTAAFYNAMNIGDWDLAAEVGEENDYGDYSNVIIVKGRTGALYDPTSADTIAQSLVSNPLKWTLAADFAAPGGRVDELVPLSYWLQTYFQDAAAQTSDLFDRFNTIARQPSWTGILVLRMKIAGIPADLAGITAGVTAPELFNAHHFAVEISQVQNDPTAPDIQLQPTTSSMFGLIDYVDPAFTVPSGDTPPAPVPPKLGEPYDFRLLALQVLFENSAVARFQSFAQVTLNRLFDMPVTRMGPGGNPYNTIVLRGSYQSSGDNASYSLTSATDSTFYFDSNVINKVEITGAQMTTLDPGTSDPQSNVSSWFGFTGFLDFLTPTFVPPGASAPVPFDVFSFGNVDPRSSDQLRQGLGFSDLGLRLDFPKGDPSQRSFTFAVDRMQFDPVTSTPRPGSLFRQFALDLGGITGGDQTSGPAQAGFLPAITDAMFTGVGSGAWYGITYRLDMGSPGALAAQAGFTSQLVTAWSPASAGTGGYQAFVGVALPGTGGGAKLLSLENVLKLSIGQIRLAYDVDQSAFLLLFTSISLKLLGLLTVPPGGTSSFFLFGNPESDGKPSGLGWYAMYRKSS